MQDTGSKAEIISYDKLINKQIKQLKPKHKLDKTIDKNFSIFGSTVVETVNGNVIKLNKTGQTSWDNCSSWDNCCKLKDQLVGYKEYTITVVNNINDMFIGITGGNNET